MFYKKPAFILYTACMAFCLLLAGCSTDTNSRLALTQEQNKKISLHHNEIRQILPASEFDNEKLKAISAHYDNHGNGPVDVVVTYDPKSSGNTAMTAASEAARISGVLTKSGIANVQTDIMPVSGQGAQSRVMVNYKIVTAKAPAGCEAMGGLEGHETSANQDYIFGCTTQMQLARQIARPKDLLGREGLDTADGRRQSNIVEVYKTGVPNEALAQAESSSEN